MELKDPDAMGMAVSPVCGDVLKLFLKVKNGVITKATFKTAGCGAAIASGSILTELLEGKTLEEAHKVTGQLISEALGGLPAIKMHCPELAVEALKNALKDQTHTKHPGPTNHHKKH